jgi:hypothetical protein
VTVHDFPGSIFRPEDGRDPQSYRRHVLPSADFRLVPLYLQRVRKVGGDVLRYALEANGPSILVIHRSSLHRFSSPLPSTPGREEGIRKRNVFSMRKEIFQRFGISGHELT